MQRCIFSVTWSSEIILICWFAVQETFLIIIDVKILNFYCIFKYIYVALVSRRDSKSIKNIKILIIPNLWPVA